MQTYANKKQENQSKAADDFSPTQSSNTSTFQFMDNRPEATSQRKMQEVANHSQRTRRIAQLQVRANDYAAPQPMQKKANKTGLPNKLKTGIESLSGYSMDDVKVHYNSDKPAQLNAHAYAQGTDIHVATGQEKHLPHEAWHVVQQKQGRVKPTMQMRGKVNVNDDAGLEKEADVMGRKTMKIFSSVKLKATENTNKATIQRSIIVGKDTYKGNMDELMHKLGIDGDFIKEKLKEKEVSIAQVLTRFDFKNRRFDNVRSLIAAIKDELKNDIGHDDGFINSFVPDHPLAQDNNIIHSPILKLLKKKDPSGNVKDLILEDTDAAKSVMESYKKATKHADSDTILFKSILATIELHKSGASHHNEYTEEEQKLLSYVQMAYDGDTVKEMIKDYGLDDYEHKAIKAYSLPNKGEIFVDGKWNKYYMGYSKLNWFTHKDGWTALASAMKKLPSLDELKLSVTTYRTSRDNKESESLKNLNKDAYILHGKNILEQEQRHYTSTALTYSSFTDPGRIQKANSLMAISGGSGVFINPFGKQSFVDGGEILYPPGLVSTLTEKAEGAYSHKDFQVPVYHLQEVPLNSVNRGKLVDDFKFEKLEREPIENKKQEEEQIKALVDQIQKFYKILDAGEKLEASEKEIKYLTKKKKNLFNHIKNEKKIKYLTKKKKELFNNIENDKQNPNFIENYRKLALINKLRAIPEKRKIGFKNYFESDSLLWGLSYSELEEFAKKFAPL